MSWFRPISPKAQSPRFSIFQKFPDKRAELRLGSLRPMRILSRLVASAEPFHDTAKLSRELRRNAKLRLFRMLKLIDEKVEQPAAFRQLGDRLRNLGWMRRL